MHARTVSTLCRTRSASHILYKNNFSSHHYTIHIGGNRQRYASNFKPNYLTKKVRLNRFVKKFVRKPIRSRWVPPATFQRGFCSKSLFGLYEIRLLNKYSFFSPCSVYSTLHCFLNGCPVYFCRGHGRGFIAVFIMSRVWRALF